MSASPYRRHAVTVEHLRRLATVDQRSLFRDAAALIDCDQGIIAVTWDVVTAALEGRSKLISCRLLYARESFADDGVVIGETPKTTDGDDLNARLAVIAAGLNDAPEDREAAR